MTAQSTMECPCRPLIPNTGPRAARPDKGQTCGSAPDAHRELEEGRLSEEVRTGQGNIQEAGGEGDGAEGEPAHGQVAHLT